MASYSITKSTPHAMQCWISVKPCQASAGLAEVSTRINPAQEEDGSDFEVSEAEVKISKSDDLGMRKSNEHGFQ